jgi:hypothetical protein
MSKGPKTRGSRGPTSPRGIYIGSLKAPGGSADMPDEIKGMKKGGMARSSASKRADGCAVRGKTRGKMV